MDFRVLAETAGVRKDMVEWGQGFVDAGRTGGRAPVTSRSKKPHSAPAAQWGRPGPRAGSRHLLSACCAPGPVDEAENQGGQALSSWSARG